MSDYRSLQVWQRAHALVLLVYERTTAFPRDERFGLTGQVRRAAASIPANLAEGVGRGSRPELARFCRISLGSLNELEYHLLLARDLGYLTAADHGPLADEISQLRRMLGRLLQSVIRTGNW